MRDYIDVLLNELEEQWVTFLDGEYFLQKARSDHAEKALQETFSESQAELFIAYEEQHNAMAVIYEAAMARQAFLLAKEIYR